MKIEQFRQDLTTEQLNDTLGKVFGTAIDLTKFSTEQLETAQNQVLDKIATIEQTEAFDSITHNEDYHKQKMFLDVITSALKDRANEGKLQNTILVHADEIVGDYFDADEEALKMNKDAVIADMKKRQGNAKGDEADALHYAIQKVEHDFDDDGQMKINPYESNAFAQAVQKAKAAGMKKGDKFKVGDKEYTLEDMEKLVDTMKNKDVQEKSKPDYIDLDKDGNKTEPMKKAAKDKKAKADDSVEEAKVEEEPNEGNAFTCLLYTSPSPRDQRG